MTQALHIGIGYVTFFLRSSPTPKERRQILQSIAQKLRNRGFSVTTMSSADNVRQGSLGFSYAGNSHVATAKALEGAPPLWEGLEVVQWDSEVLNYGEISSPEEVSNPELDDKYD